MRGPGGELKGDRVVGFCCESIGFYNRIDCVCVAEKNLVNMDIVHASSHVA